MPEPDDGFGNGVLQEFEASVSAGCLFSRSAPGWLLK